MSLPNYCELIDQFRKDESPKINCINNLRAPDVSSSNVAISMILPGTLFWALLTSHFLQRKFFRYLNTKSHKAAISTSAKMSDEILVTENCAVGAQDSVVSGERVTTYSWNHGKAKDAPVGIVLLLHGFRSHACFNVSFFVLFFRLTYSNLFFSI